MKRFLSHLVLFAVLVIMAVGCQNDSNPVQPAGPTGPASTSKITIPGGATIVSATLHLYISVAANKQVDVHRITAPWTEMTVTWNSFGEAFAPEIVSSFMSDAVGWKTVDVTTLVQDWANGTYPNYGLLLDQAVESYPRTVYDSKEGTNDPYLEVCYDAGEGTVCVPTITLGDTYIHQLAPDMNNGARPIIFTGWGWPTDLEKQSLLIFELEVTPELAAIGDFVWHDVNNNGIQDMGELGVPGVTVNLYDCGDHLVATTITDANGYYLFDNLTPGDYYVEFILPMGYFFSPKDQGLNDAVDSDADVATGKTVCTTLSPGETDLTWDAGLYTPPMLAAIGDFVWFDVNNNGIQDMGELGVPGVTVNLYDCEDHLIATTTTDANGYYLFSNLTPGDYYVEFVAPAGYVFSPKDQGLNDAVDSDADVVTGTTICTTLSPGETDLTWDAGLYRPPQEGCSLTIGYWKNHAGFGPQADMVTPLLPIWLGNDGGAKSLHVTTAAIAVNVLVMKTYGTEENGITKLYAQLLGAKLNAANGASTIDIDAVMADADAFLATHDWLDWESLDDPTQQMVLDWMEALDDYNMGDIGPGHCED